MPIFNDDGSCVEHGKKMCPKCANLKMRKKYTKKQRSEWARRGGLVGKGGRPRKEKQE